MFLWQGLGMRGLENSTEGVEKGTGRILSQSWVLIGVYHSLDQGFKVKLN